MLQWRAFAMALTPVTEASIDVSLALLVHLD